MQGRFTTNTTTSGSTTNPVLALRDHSLADDAEVRAAAVTTLRNLYEDTEPFACVLNKIVEWVKTAESGAGRGPFLADHEPAVLL